MLFRKLSILTLLVSFAFCSVNASSLIINNTPKKKRAKSKTVTKRATQKKTKKIVTVDGVVDDPDIDAMYTGGTIELNKFISNNLVYPEEAKAQNLSGLVVIKFVVEKDGTLSNLEMIHRADTLLNNEALRLVKLMPPWRPAKYKGEFVKSRGALPLYFRYNNNAKTVAKNRPAAKPVGEEIEDSDIYSIVDKMPSYPDGLTALSEFIGSQLRYPEAARQEGISGRILCSFIVKNNGHISNVEVIKGIDPLLDEEAVRIINLMPQWIPGENNGQKVNVKCILPIDFTINDVTQL